MHKPIKIEEVHQTCGGKAIKKAMTLRNFQELVNSGEIKSAAHPACPFSRQESRERFKKSCEDGHLQVYCKCQNCSLEFTIKSWRTKVEALEAYQPSHGEYGGHSRILTCPECREAAVLWLKDRQVDNAIFETLQ